MPYRCDFLDKNEKTIRVKFLSSDGDFNAHREAMRLMPTIERFSGYVLWNPQGRIVGTHWRFALSHSEADFAVAGISRSYA